MPMVLKNQEFTTHTYVVFCSQSDEQHIWTENYIAIPKTADFHRHFPYRYPSFKFPIFVGKWENIPNSNLNLALFSSRCLKSLTKYLTFSSFSNALLGVALFHRKKVMESGEMVFTLNSEQYQANLVRYANRLWGFHYCFCLSHCNWEQIWRLLAPSGVWNMNYWLAMFSYSRWVNAEKCWMSIIGKRILISCRWN